MANAGASATGERRGRIFLADDDDVFRSVMKKELVAQGYDVSEVGDGERALEALAKAADGDAPAPDVVVLDVCMPGYSGLGVLSVMRRFPNAPPTFVITGFEDRSVDVLARNLGAVRVFHKPVDLEEVLAAVTGAAEGR